MANGDHDHTKIIKRNACIWMNKKLILILVEFAWSAVVHAQKRQLWPRGLASRIHVHVRFSIHGKKTPGHFALRAPSRRVWWVGFGVMEWGVVCAAATAAVGLIES